MGIWEVVGFVLICWWSISTIVKNYRYFRALKIEGKSVMPDFSPLLSLIFFRRTYAKAEKEWVERTLEQKNNR